MGPTKREVIEDKKFERMTFTAKKVVKEVSAEYFRDPLSYLLYILLTATSFGMLAGIVFPWQSYAFLSILSGIEIYRKWYLKQ